MDVSRSYYEEVFLGFFLLVSSVLFSSISLLVGSASVFAWILAKEIDFYLLFDEMERGLDVNLELSKNYIHTGEDIEADLSVEMSRGNVEDGGVEIRPWRSIHFEVKGDSAVDMRDGSLCGTRYRLVPDTPGRFRYGEIEVRVEGRYGLFGEWFLSDEIQEVTVEAGESANLYLSSGDEEIGLVGGHHAGRIGSSEGAVSHIKEYEPGDSVNLINWKATARLNDVYTNQLDTKRSRNTLFVFDEKPSADGDSGERQIGYLREVAVGIFDSSVKTGDPIGLHIVGEDGIHETVESGSTEDHYRTVKNHLLKTTPYGDEARERRKSEPVRYRMDEPHSDDRFYETLGRYSPSNLSVERDKSRLGAIPRKVAASVDGKPWVVIFTSSADRSSLLESVKALTPVSEKVTIFVSPAVLHESASLVDVDERYNRYMDFRKFETRLSQISGVTVYEVTPKERLEGIYREIKRKET